MGWRRGVEKMRIELEKKRREDEDWVGEEEKRRLGWVGGEEKMRIGLEKKRR